MIRSLCIRRASAADERTTWCGRAFDERTFVDIDHAVETALAEHPEFTVCAECAQAIAEALNADVKRGKKLGAVKAEKAKPEIERRRQLLREHGDPAAQGAATAAKAMTE